MRLVVAGLLASACQKALHGDAGLQYTLRSLSTAQVDLSTSSLPVKDGRVYSCEMGLHVCRLAMQLLAARRSEAEKALKQERSAPTAQAIARHRLALLAEVSSL